jgi:hypothetical protein
MDQSWPTSRVHYPTLGVFLLQPSSRVRTSPAGPNREANPSGEAARDAWAGGGPLWEPRSTEGSARSARLVAALIAASESRRVSAPARPLEVPTAEV